jgi:peptidyl-prolyl cis-trans isomerase SurA
MAFKSILFTVLLATANANATLVDKTAAIVNSDVITLSDTQYFVKNMSLRQELDPFVNFFKKAPDNEQEILQYLIQEVLIMQKLLPTKEEVEEEINSIQRNNKIDRDKLKDVLRAQGINFDDYYSLMKVSAAKRRLMEREIRPLSQVSDEEVKNFYYTAAEFQARKGARSLILSYDLEQLALPTKELADEASSKLKQGNDLSAIASNLSERGVELNQLGMISEEKLAPSVLKAVQGLRVGEYSPAIFTGSGYFILRIREISAPSDPVFEKEKENIRNRLFQKAMARHLMDWTERERAQAYIYIP